MRAAAAACLLAVLVGGCGGKSHTRKDPFVAIERNFRPPDPSRRASPHWVPLRTLRGAGATSATVTIDRHAIQWRMRWKCRAGTLSVAITPRPAGSATSRGSCPGRRTVTVIGTGPHRLAVTASAPWRLTVEQQVDTPVHEPRLSAMTPAHAVAHGAFVPIEHAGRGTATVYRLPSGRLGLRLEHFVTDPNNSLFVWLSRARAPRTTRQVLAAPHRVAGALTATVGDQNYRLPRGTRLADARSVVIWCLPVRVAYTAAPLTVAGA